MTKVMLRTNRKSHTRFRLVPKSMTLDDLERPKRHSCRNQQDAKMTARCALYMASCPENFRESLSTPTVTFTEIFNDRRCWASTSAWALNYLAVKLFSKNSNLCDHDT